MLSSREYARTAGVLSVDGADTGTNIEPTGTVPHISCSVSERTVDTAVSKYPAASRDCNSHYELSRRPDIGLQPTSS